jgi:D-serine deaminase-like pyridoxal phosphate-dependent protein
VSSTRAAQRSRYDRATADLDPPFAIVDLDAFDANGAALAARANGKPLRVPSKSVRVRALLDRVLARPGWRGIMAFTLPEAIWLAEHGTADDILVAYPTADRAALRRLAADEKLADTITVMADSAEQLDLLDAVVPPAQRAATSTRPGGHWPACTSACGAHPCTARPRPARSPPRSRAGPASGWSA